MSQKQKLSASVDRELIQAAEQAVRRGRAPTVSQWVNDALRLKLAQEERQEALAAFIAAYEAEEGEITHEEIEDASRRARARALRARSLVPRKAKRGRTRRCT